MHNVDFWLKQQTRRLEQNAAQALLNIRRATGMREVVAAANVSIPAELRGIAKNTPSVRGVHQAAENKLESLFEAHVAMLRAAMSDKATFKTLLSRYQRTEWAFLRGSHPRLAARASAVSRELLGLLDKAEP